MQHLKMMAMVCLSAISLLWIPPECRAQPDTHDWVAHGANRAWFVARHEDNPLNVAHPDDPERKAIGLILHVTEVSSPIFRVRVFAYFDHEIDGHGVDRYSEPLELTSHPNVVFSTFPPVDEPPGHRKLKFQFKNGPMDGRWFRLTGIRRRDDSVIRLFVINYGAAEKVVGCDEPPTEDILEEELFDPESPEEPAPEYDDEAPA